MNKEDINSIMVDARKWFLQDIFDKPSTLSLLRPTYQGGLGLQAPEQRARAMLIKTFLEQSVPTG